MKLGDDYQYLVKGSGEVSYKLDSEKSLKMKDVLYVPGLKKNIISISALYAKVLFRNKHPYNIGSGVTNLLLKLADN